MSIAFYSQFDPTVITDSSALDTFLNGNASFSKLITSVIVADTNYTITDTSNVYVKYSTLTASRAITLPLAASSPGQLIIVADGSGSITYSILLNITCSGSDTIHTSSSLSIDMTYGYLLLLSLGGTVWKIISKKHDSIPATNLSTLNHYPPSHYNCGGGCSWTCVSGCTGGCISCTASCSNLCSTCSSCTGSCSDGCSTCSGTCSSCTGCSGSCSSSCTGSCTSCSGCSGCGSCAPSD